MPSTFFCAVPRSVHCATGDGDTPAGTVPASFWPFVISPKPADRPGPTTRPSSTASVERSTFHCAAARSISISRAAAAARASCGAIRGVDCDPNVPWSYGTRSVSAITSDTRSSGTRNSSAIACASDVRMFWPISVLPVYPVMRPSSPTWTHADTSVDAACCPVRPDSCAEPGIEANTSNPPPITPKMRMNSRRSTSNRYGDASASSYRSISTSISTGGLIAAPRRSRSS